MSACELWADEERSIGTLPEDRCSNTVACRWQKHNIGNVGANTLVKQLIFAPLLLDLLALLVPWTNKSFNAGAVSDSVPGVIEYFCSILKICFSFPICLLRQGHLCLVIERESLPEHISNTGGNFVHHKELRLGVHVTQHSTGLIYDEREEKIKGLIHCWNAAVLNST